MTTEIPSESALDSTTGWSIVGLGVLVLVLVWGTVFTFTVYAGELGATFGLSSFRASSVFSITTASFLVAGGAIGVPVARLPLRPVVAATGVALGGAVALLQVVSTYPAVVVAFGLFGAAGGTAVVVVISLVPQWFDAYEGRAMGITMTGNGLGVLLLPFVWLWLFERTDIRGAFAVVGGATVVTLLLASLVYRRPPGAALDETTPVDRAWLRATLTDVRFQSAAAGFALLWTWYFVLSAGLVDVLTATGIRRTVATAAFGTIGGISVVTRVGNGVVADRIGMRTTFTGGVVLAGAGSVMLSGAGSRPVLYLPLVVFGIGLGAVASLYSPIVVRRFGPENASAVVGLFNVVEAVTAFLAPIGLNALVGVTGGYTLPLVALTGVTFLGAGLFYWGTSPAGS